MSGVAMLSFAAAYLLGPWREADWSLNYNAVPSVLMWLLILAVIPGIALLALGRGRTRADRTIAGCALAALGIGTALSKWLLQVLEPSGLLGIVGLLVLLSAMVPKPTRALARGVLLCGAGVLALAFLDVLVRPYRGVFVPSFSLVIGGALGVIVVTAGGIALRRAAGASTPLAEGPSLSAGRLGCVLAGVVLLTFSAALSLVPASHWWKIGLSWHESYRSLISSLAWLVMLGLIPGIALLAMGRGRARADETMVGCALVTLTPSGLLFGYIPLIPLVISLLLAIAGLLLSLIPAFPRPTPALARGYLICGAGTLALAAIATLYRFRVIHTPNQNLVIGFAIGVILVLAGLVARQMARTGMARLPAAAARR
ncbi:hypothetical protein BST12_24290 [Mycobacterium angelicum]|uniref:Uncharacterized protein n=3 Tax=Mycobacterium angelicum TaxID=470074 RepID=A0A1W9ZE79_MYCAN|nr:hypothetical protein [Mycobacterium angelicum]ORA13257.1 hypothetical protein BST12_24290 [Mycobacterium angelicum]